MFLFFFWWLGCQLPMSAGFGHARLRWVGWNRHSFLQIWYCYFSHFLYDTIFCRIVVSNMSTMLCFKIFQPYLCFERWAMVKRQFRVVQGADVLSKCLAVTSSSVAQRWFLASQLLDELSLQLLQESNWSGEQKNDNMKWQRHTCICICQEVLISLTIQAHRYDINKFMNIADI